MIRLSITMEAYEAIKATMPGEVGEPQLDERGAIAIWLNPKIVDELKRQRRPGESYSDVILRLAKEEG